MHKQIYCKPKYGSLSPQIKKTLEEGDSPKNVVHPCKMIELEQAIARLAGWLARMF
jgi:hypothetical protein